MRSSPQTLALAAAATFVAVLIVWPTRKTALAVASPVVEPPLPESAPAPASPFGLRVEGDQVVLDREGWGAWMAEAPEAVAEAIEAGAGGARGVTIALMRRALPEHRWPPREGDPGFAQWPAIVRTVAEAFSLEPEPEPTKRPFRLVKE